MTADTTMEKMLAMNNFISVHTRDVLKQNDPAFFNQELFDTLEKLCRDYVLTRSQERERILEQAKANRFSAEILISRIKHYYNYSATKGAKMRFTKKELDQAFENLSVEEQQTVLTWMQDNGGIDKYIVVGYNA